MTPSQYIISVFIEECNEVAHAASKVNRFTPHDSHTIGGPTNLETLHSEWNDLLAMQEMLEEQGIILTRDPGRIARKKQRVLDYMNYSKQLGVVKDVQSS